MIASADAVIDPWAVMIKPLYALVADAAVAWPLSPYDLAVGTQKNRVEVLKHGEKWNIVWLLKVAWVLKGADHEEQESDPNEAWVDIEPQVAIRLIN
jgi:hypothetical protein